MRRILVLTVLCLVTPVLASAQQKQALSVFLTDVTSSTNEQSYDRWGRFGVSFERMFAERLSLQAAASYERHRSYPYVVEDDGSITEVGSQRLTVYPIDVTARYHWLNDTRWKPYLGLGAHYVAAPNVDRRFRYQNHWDGLIDGGVTFLITPQIGVFVEGRQLVGDRESYDPLFRVLAGLSWRF